MMHTLSAMAQYWVAVFIGLLALGGFGALFIWAWLSGQFRDVEAPKHRMLDLDETTGVKDE